MGRHLPLVTLLAVLDVSAFVQYGTAPNNYYPDNYNGSTFTGVVVQNANDQITLTYTKGNKTDTFTGRFEAACSVPSTLQALGTPIGAHDYLIAGQALARQLTLVTANVSGFSRVKGLSWQDWAKP